MTGSVNKKYAFTFVGQIIPQDILNSNFELLNKTVDIAGNTFYTSFLNGMAMNDGVVYANSYLCSDVKSRVSNGLYDDVNYSFKRYIKFPLLRFLYLFICGFKQIRELKRIGRKEGYNVYAIINPLRISSSLGARLACKIFNIKSIAIITDVPGYRINQNKRGLVDLIGKKLVEKNNCYVLLSESMKEVVIGQAKTPYCIIEGVYSENHPSKEVETKREEVNKFNAVYAGSLHYQYGIMNLIDAVICPNVSNIVLHVYGKGDAEEEIKRISENSPKIVYHGIVARSVLLDIEANCDLLINPRPVDDDYVKYSFPSKTMEYMASGTPVLMTNIPSLPDDYKEYIFLAEDNSVDVLRDKIIEIMKIDRQDLRCKGSLARNFIVNNKTAVKQTEKLFELL